MMCRSHGHVALFAVLFLSMLACASCARLKRRRDKNEKPAVTGVPTYGEARAVFSKGEKRADVGQADLEDSNVRDIGSAADKQARLKAAREEEAWKKAGTKPGIEIWRVEKFKVVPWDPDEYGNFYKGDSYVVLHTIKKPDVDKLTHDIHFWLGKDTTPDEAGTAAYKTVELDDLFGGEPKQYREVMGEESAKFKALFKQGLFYLDGGMETGFRKVGAAVYTGKLFRVRKTPTIAQAFEVTHECASLTIGDCFVLDAGEFIYKWCGKKANNFEQYRATLLAKSIGKQRNGRSKVLDDVDANFWSRLGAPAGETCVIQEEQQSGNIDTAAVLERGEGVLFMLSNKGDTLETTEVGRGELTKGMLNPSNVMLLDTHSELFVWIGRGADTDERRAAYSTAVQYLRTNERPMTTSIKMFMDKDDQVIDDPVWKEIFKN